MFILFILKILIKINSLLEGNNSASMLGFEFNALYIYFSLVFYTERERKREKRERDLTLWLYKTVCNFKRAVFIQWHFKACVYR